MSWKLNWSARALCAAVAGMSMVSAASADVTTDAWDISQGNVVMSTWPSGLYTGSDIRNMFGGQFGTIEVGNAIYPDAGWLPGNAVSVTWETPAVMDLQRFVLSVAADGDYPNTYNRAIRGFKLYSSADGNVWDPIYDSGLLAAPLGSLNAGIYSYTIDHTFASVASSKHFMAEFVCDTTTGPRIIELDGYAAVVPEPGSLSLAALGVLALLRRGRRLPGTAKTSVHMSIVGSR